MEEDLEELIKVANQEDLGDVAGRLAEEILRLREGLSDANATVRQHQRDAVVDEGRIRRLRNALLAAGVSEELVAAIEWDR